MKKRIIMSACVCGLIAGVFLPGANVVRQMAVGMTAFVFVLSLLFYTMRYRLRPSAFEQKTASSARIFKSACIGGVAAGLFLPVGDPITKIIIGIVDFLVLWVILQWLKRGMPEARRVDV